MNAVPYYTGLYETHTAASLRHFTQAFIVLQHECEIKSARQKLVNENGLCRTERHKYGNTTFITEISFKFNTKTVNKLRQLKNKKKTGEVVKREKENRINRSDREVGTRRTMKARISFKSLLRGSEKQDVAAASSLVGYQSERRDAGGRGFNGRQLVKYA